MKLLFTMIFIGSIYSLNASNKVQEIDNKQWMLDLKALVMMSNKKVNALQGTDENNNGVRDDIEKYIWSKYRDDRFQRDMFFTAAKMIQTIIALPLKNAKEQHIQLDRKLLEVYTCRDYILYRNEAKDLEQEMLNKTLFKGKVLNTPERLRAYINHKKILPLNLEELTEENLIKDKNSCLALYNTYQDEENKSTVSIIDNKI